MEDEVDQCSVAKKSFEIEKKQLLINNDRILEENIASDIMCTYLRSLNEVDNCGKCKSLDVVLLDLQESNKLLKVSPRLPVPHRILKPSYVSSKLLPEIASEYQIHNEEDIACMRAACDIYFTEFDNHLLKIVIEDGDIMSIDINVYLNMDKVSVLENASNYIIKLQGRVLELEGSPGTKRKHVHESVIYVKGSRRSASDDEYYLSDYMNSEVGRNSGYLKIGYAAYEVIIVELSTLIRDLHMMALALALELCCTLISDRSSLLQGQALLALKNFFATLFYSANTSFDALLVSLLLTAKSSHQSAGIVKQALFSIA
ncbi:hypothetical protein Tco_1447343 [Tanacetum coccineum]